MAIEKRRKVNQIELTENGAIQIRETIQAFDGDEPIGPPQFHRSVVMPGEPFPEGLNTDFDLTKISQGTWTTPIVERDNVRKQKEKEELERREAEAVARAEEARIRREQTQREEDERITRAVEEKIKDGSIKISSTADPVRGGGRT